MPPERTVTFPPPLFPQLRNEQWLREQVKDGRGPVEIADQLGCGTQIVRRFLEEYGLTGPRRIDATYYPADIILLMARRSHSMTELYERLELSRATTQMVIARAGLTVEEVRAQLLPPVPSPHAQQVRAQAEQRRRAHAEKKRQLEARDAEWERLYVKEQWTIGQIAAQCNMDPSSVYKKLFARGIDMTRARREPKSGVRTICEPEPDLHPS